MAGPWDASSSGQLPAFSNLHVPLPFNHRIATEWSSQEPWSPIFSTQVFQGSPRPMKPQASSTSQHSCLSIGTAITRDSGIDVEESIRDSVPEAIDYAPAITPSSGRYSCPYRKRNPRMFNACDFPKCALGSFDTISEVKRHVIGNHQSKDFPYECRVCTSRFRRRKDLDNHFNAQPCRQPPTVNGHESGVNDTILAILKDRRQGSRVGTWEDLWNVIFPDCDPMTPDFIPPRLAHEQTDTSTQTSPEDSHQSTAISESRPFLHLQQETTDCQTRSTVRYKTTMPKTSAPLQQVGLAKVHIEILSLSEQHRRWRRDETESVDGSASETDSEGSDDDACGSEAQDSDGSPADTSTGTSSTAGYATQGQASAPAAGQPALPRKRSRADETEDDGNDNDRPGKRRRRQPRTMESARGRFACPYQAFEPWRDCFKPSQRNPKGGCDSISRLKDHMTRKHMLSYRCQRCWKQFNARHKVQEHLQADCVQKEMPTYEWFMTMEQETEVENCTGAEPEDTWWKLFRLLIPGMAAEDLLQLKGHYFPYYVHVDMSLTIPSLNLSNVSFEDAPTQSSGHANGNATTPAFLTSPSDAFWGLGNTSQTSQSFAVPIYGAPIRQPSSIPSFEGSDLDLMALSGTQQSTESDSTAPSDRINMSSTPASSLNVTPGPTSDMSQMQRNYERQKTRASQAEAENGELQRTIRATREQVRDASVLLEGVLGIENLDSEVYEQVSRAAEILIVVTGRLR